MHRADNDYKAYLELLREELVPAMGCTEPISLAYAAACARELLGTLPDRVKVEASGSIIKNVKSVVVPNTGGARGISVAAAAGIVAGRADKLLECLAEVSEAQIKEIHDFMARVPITLKPLNDGHVFDILVSVFAGEHSARVRIVEYHTNLVYMEKDSAVLRDELSQPGEEEEGHSFMSMEGIWDFVHSAELSDVEDILQRQIDCNMAIAREGLERLYGAGVEKTILDFSDESVSTRAKAWAAAASDARMNGCEMPVVINSGSGNQGITASVPVVIYAQELKCNRDTLLRALLVSNLVTLYAKSGVGRLSAFCGAVCAGAGAGAGIAYLHGADFELVSQTVVNALAVVAGVICDGAKSSCAAKIDVAVNAGIFGYRMASAGRRFQAGEGIVSAGVEETIRNVGRLAREGMRETNIEIINMMSGN